MKATLLKTAGKVFGGVDVAIETTQRGLNNLEAQVSTMLDKSLTKEEVIKNRLLKTEESIAKMNEAKTKAVSTFKSKLEELKSKRLSNVKTEENVQQG